MTNIHNHFNSEAAYLANRLEADPTTAAQIKEAMGVPRLCELLDIPDPTNLVQDMELMKGDYEDQLQVALREIDRLNQLLNGR